MDLFNSTGAIFSPCQKYRYRLWRIWDNEKPKVFFIMLNPSKANVFSDDPTIRRCKQFAYSWGYGGIYVGNLFSFISTDPKLLMEVTDPTGPENMYHLNAMKSKTEITICAWGNKQGWPSFISNITKNPYVLELAKDGTPKHPLYLRSNLRPKKYFTKRNN